MTLRLRPHPTRVLFSSFFFRLAFCREMFLAFCKKFPQNLFFFLFLSLELFGLLAWHVWWNPKKRKINPIKRKRNSMFRAPWCKSVKCGGEDESRQTRLYNLTCSAAAAAAPAGQSHHHSSHFDSPPLMYGLVCVREEAIELATGKRRRRNKVAP